MAKSGVASATAPANALRGRTASMALPTVPDPQNTVPRRPIALRVDNGLRYDTAVIGLRCHARAMDGGTIGGYLFIVVARHVPVVDDGTVPSLPRIPDFEP